MTELYKLKNISYYGKCASFCFLMRFLPLRQICLMVNKLSSDVFFALMELDTNEQIISRYAGGRAGDIIQYFAAKKLKFIMTMRKIKANRGDEDASLFWF